MASERADMLMPGGGVAIGANVRLLRQVVVACLGRVLCDDAPDEPLSVERCYLRDEYAPLGGVSDMRTLLQQVLDCPQPPDMRIAELASVLHLSDVEVAAIVLALLVEEEPMMGRVLADVQAPVGGSRPTLGLLEVCFTPLVDARTNGSVMGGLVAGRARRAGVLEVPDDQAPLPEQVIRVPTQLALALRGRDHHWSGSRLLVAGEGVHLPASFTEQARSHARALVCTPAGALVVRSAWPAEARSVAACIAEALDKEALLVNPERDPLAGLGALCHIESRLPVFDLTATHDASPELPDLMPYNGPYIVLTAADAEPRCVRTTALQWTLGVPAREERQTLWQAYLDDVDLAATLAGAHIHGAGRISELAELAVREAHRRGHARPDAADVRAAIWDAELGHLSSLAHAVKARVPDEALVLSRPVRAELEQLLARCRHRENLDAGLGITIATRYLPGVRCLMVGPSGTGKTLAASWLATRLALPLYRVDLASVVSKYIGETEKNLSELLAKAEHADIVLLFDEADSLFGKRTEIRDSTDRFANSQTNYLLQRIENYRGIVLLTSNSRERFDAAFSRRLDSVIEFPLPSPRERRALWQVHLGEAHDLTRKHINQLAVDSDLSGGQIRNAVLSAAVRAASMQRAMVMDDVLFGLAGEYRKLARQLPAPLRRSGDAVLDNGRG